MRVFLRLRVAEASLLGLGLGEDADLAEFLVARVEQVGCFHVEKFVEMFENGLLQRRGGGVVILVRAAERFGNDFVHDRRVRAGLWR